MRSDEFAGYSRGKRPPEAVRLDLNEAPREAGKAFRNALLARLAAAAWRRYPDMDARTAREAAAALYGWDAAGTLVGNGSNDLLAAAVRALLPAGGTLFSLTPSFSMYPVLAERMGARLSTVPLEPPSFTADAERVLAGVRGADLVLLCSPNNPTGGVLDEEVIDEAAALGKPLIWDGAYIEFAGLDPRPLLRRHDNVIVLRSLSKVWGLAGFRAGAMLATPALAARVSAQLLPFGTGIAVEAAFVTAAELRPAGEALIAEVTAERERQCAALFLLDGVEVVPSSGNFFLMRRPGLSGDELVAALAERGIAVREIAELSQAGYVRVTVGTPAEGDRLLAAVSEVVHG